MIKFQLTEETLQKQLRNSAALFLVAMALLASSSSSVQAATPPDLINYQGVLRDNNNKPLTGSYDVVFHFFDAQTGGNELLVDRHLAAGAGAVTVTGGLFNVQLGSGEVLDGAGAGVITSLGQAFQQSNSVFLEVQVAGETLSPRTRVASAAYALNGATDQPVTLIYSNAGTGTDSNSFTVPAGAFTSRDLIQVIIITDGGLPSTLNLTNGPGLHTQNLGVLTGNLGFVDMWIVSRGSNNEFAFSREMAPTGNAGPRSVQTSSSRDIGIQDLGQDWMSGSFQIYWSSAISDRWKWWIFRVRG